MTARELELREPSLELLAAFKEMLDETLAQGEDGYPRLFDLLGLALDDLPGFVRRLDEFRRGVNLPWGLVPSSTWWLVADGGRVVGESRLRHRLTPGLNLEGGHIGYMVRPSARRLGYGTRLLALTMERARGEGLERVLVTCNSDNLASARIIQKNGGQFENEVVSPVSGKMVSRYWIEL